MDRVGQGRLAAQGVKVGLKDIEPLLQFVEATSGLSSSDAVAHAVQDSVSDLGLAYFALRLNLEHIPQDSRIDGVCNLPVPWTKRFTEAGYAKVTPTFKQARVSREPFNWFGLLSRPETSELERRILLESFDCGMGMGIGVPVHGTDGSVSVFFVTTDDARDPTADIIRSKMRAIQLLGLGVHEVAAPLLRGKRIELGTESVEDGSANDNSDPDSKARKPLTPFERDFLAWSANGSSNHDIADRRGIPVAMVDQAMGSAAAKLDATSRSHAVVKAILQNMVQP